MAICPIDKTDAEASNTPVVRIFLHASGFSITLCVENIGTGFAQDIKFKGDLSFKPTEPGEATIGELNPFKDGIDYLGPGHKSETFLFHRGELTQLPNHTFPITVTYKDLAGFKDEKTFTFEIGNWENTDQFGSPHTDSVANAVERVAQQLEQASRKQSSEHRQQWGSTRINQLLNIKDPQMVVLERIADALEKKSSDE